VADEFQDAQMQPAAGWIGGAEEIELSADKRLGET
jgi:hypothetical protein